MDDDERAVDKTGQQIKDVAGAHTIPRAHRLGGVEAAPVGVDGQPARHDAFRVGQQLPAPVDHRAQGLLPGWCIPVPAGQQPEPVVEAVE